MTLSTEGAYRPRTRSTTGDATYAGAPISEPSARTGDRSLVGLRWCCSTATRRFCERPLRKARPAVHGDLTDGLPLQLKRTAPTERRSGLPYSGQGSQTLREMPIMRNVVRKAARWRSVSEPDRAVVEVHVEPYLPTQRPVGRVRVSRT